jgi:hypothetical protein
MDSEWRISRGNLHVASGAEHVKARSLGSLLDLLDRMECFVFESNLHGMKVTDRCIILNAQ